jgi:hypothetical protein
LPLRDHFHAPFDRQTSWDIFHGQWPAMIVQRLNRILPLRYLAGPHVHLGTEIEIDAVTFENDDAALAGLSTANGTAWQTSAPTLAVETDLLNADEYEVLVYDAERGRRLVAAVEIVSPSNKDRPESRRVFAAKCEALLRRGVSVSIIDLVTSRRFNLYAELLDLIGQNDPSMGAVPPPIYATACRWNCNGKRVLETWSHTLQLGQDLPTLPLWLAENLSVPLELEASYEETLAALRIA